MEPNPSEKQPLANTPEVAGHLKVPPATLDQWAYRGIGPRYIKVGKHRRYRWTDVEAWLEEHASSPHPAA